MLQTPEKQQQAMGQSLMRLLGLRGWIDQSDFWLAGFLIPTSGALPETGTKLCRFVAPASELFQSTPSLCMVWSLVRDSWLLGSWYELLRHNWNSAARLLHYVTIAIGVCVCVVQYCAVSMLLRTVLVLRGSQWQSRFSCFDAANPFARSGLRVLDDTHIVRILINRLSKAFRMLWLLPGKVDSAQLVWGNVSAGGAGPNTSASS